MQITEHYRDLIRRGELKNGDRLPSARQLVTEWGVAHATAAKVLTTLRSEGLVTTTSGGAGGTVVSVQDLREVGYAPRDRMLAVRRWGRIYPPGEYARIVSAEMSTAPDHVADALGVDPGATVIRRQRVTYHNDTPVSASTSWFPGALAEVVPELLATDRIPQGTAGVIEQRSGRTMSQGRDGISAALADTAVAAKLDVPVGSPVLIGRNWVRDGSGEVIEYGEWTSRPSRWATYDYELG
ncbi:MAG: hypothetical protein V7603_5014 [Micromonosporaceae bacterium]